MPHGSRKISLNDLHVSLYPRWLFDGVDELPAEGPDWSGTLLEFWAANADGGMTYGEICTIKEYLLQSGRAFVGGGACAAFTLLRVSEKHGEGS